MTIDEKQRLPAPLLTVQTVAPFAPTSSEWNTGTGTKSRFSLCLGETSRRPAPIVGTGQELLIFGAKFSRMGESSICAFAPSAKAATKVDLQVWQPVAGQSPL